MSINIHANSAAIIPLIPILKVFSIPDFYYSSLWEIDWICVVIEDNLIWVQRIREGQVVPEASGIFDVLFIWEDNVVASVRHHDVKWMIQKGWMMVTTPATVKRCTRGTAHGAFSIDKLDGGHEPSFVA